MKNKYDSPELETIFDLTVKLSSINPATVKRSKSAEQYWSFIEKTWKTSADVIGGNVMDIVLFHIHWGCYPAKMSQSTDFLKLVELAECEFLKHTSEMEIAKSKQIFRSAYTAAIKSKSPYVMQKHCWKSSTYKEFLQNKTLYKLYGGQVIVEKLNFAVTPNHILEDMKDKAMTCYKYEQFKKRINKLLPAARAWSDEEWVNQQNILTNLQNAYGINYAVEWQDFDNLMYVLGELTKDEPSMYYVLTLKSFPYQMAQAIWPTDTNGKLEKLFIHFCKKYKKYMSRAKSYSACSYKDALSMRDMILNSWLYKELYSWYANKTYELSKEARKMLFDISLSV